MVGRLLPSWNAVMLAVRAPPIWPASAGGRACNGFAFGHGSAQVHIADGRPLSPPVALVALYDCCREALPRLNQSRGRTFRPDKSSLRGRTAGCYPHARARSAIYSQLHHFHRLAGNGSALTPPCNCLDAAAFSPSLPFETVDRVAAHVPAGHAAAHRCPAPFMCTGRSTC